MATKFAVGYAEKKTFGVFRFESNDLENAKGGDMTLWDFANQITATDKE